MITIKNSAHSITFFLLLLSSKVISQQWAIRPELLLTSTKAILVENSSLFQPYTMVHSQQPDISISVDYYNKNKNRWSFGIGTFNTGIRMQGNSEDNKGIFGFLFPPAFLGSGTSGGIQVSITYEYLLFPKNRSKWFIGGGLNGWIMRPSDGGGTGFPIGNASVLNYFLYRSNSLTHGWHLRSSFIWKNKKQREVMQFNFKVNESFGKAQHTIITRYDLFWPVQLSNQVVRHKLTGAGIQIGISKTLLFLPSQKKK